MGSGAWLTTSQGKNVWCSHDLQMTVTWTSGYGIVHWSLIHHTFCHKKKERKIKVKVNLIPARKFLLWISCNITFFFFFSYVKISQTFPPVYFWKIDKFILAIYYSAAPARTVGWRDPGYIHTSFLKELWPNKGYVIIYLLILCCFWLCHMFLVTLLEAPRKLGGGKNNHKVKFLIG